MLYDDRSLSRIRAQITRLIESSMCILEHAGLSGSFENITCPYGITSQQKKSSLHFLSLLSLILVDPQGRPPTMYEYLTSGNSSSSSSSKCCI
mmetsp:Transcript_27162/g.44244  ORF Transcript_27162/g.44244 Transcript_27162/m.44244 type:complete len:93 (-) Transcript_27162:1143-1421(-)